MREPGGMEAAEGVPLKPAFDVWKLWRQGAQNFRGLPTSFGV
jgi:hypothetical protein